MTSFNSYDRACLRRWHVSAEEDRRTTAETQERLVVPEWLRRSMWRSFWAYQETLERDGWRTRVRNEWSEMANAFGRPLSREHIVGYAQHRVEPEYRCYDKVRESELTFREPLRSRVDDAGRAAILTLLAVVLGGCLYLLIHTSGC